MRWRQWRWWTWGVVFWAPIAVNAGESWAQRVQRGGRKEISVEEAAKSGVEQEQDRRNKIAMRRLKLRNTDWDADPTAIPYVHYQIEKRTDLPVYVDNEGLDPATDEVFAHTLLYATSHGRWALNEKETENLSLFLQRGGTLLLDDCYNRGSGFAESVPTEVGKLIPGAEPIMLLKEDPVVADCFKMVYPTPWPGEISDMENRPWQYYMLDQRPAIFFSPNDEGCGWEVSTPPSASNPIGEGIGHGGDNKARELMYQWAVNWVIFALTH